MTRLTNAFSKSWDLAYFNFCRIHGTLWVTPAMEAGIADRVWDIAELLA